MTEFAIQFEIENNFFPCRSEMRTFPLVFWRTEQNKKWELMFAMSATSDRSL